MIANLDRGRASERGKLIEELKTILCAHLDAKLAATKELIAPSISAMSA